MGTILLSRKAGPILTLLGMVLYRLFKLFDILAALLIFPRANEFEIGLV